MLEVDVVELKRNIDKLQSIIDEYEIIQLNIFNQLKESTVNWQDGNSVKFNDCIYLEKNESNLFLQFLQNNKNMYEYICRKYEGIGNKIKCSLKCKESFFFAIDTCYDETIDLLREFNKINNTFFYGEKDIIYLQYQKIVEVKNELKNIKFLFKELFNKIENIEINVKKHIESLEQVKINNFEFNEE